MYMYAGAGSSFKLQGVSVYNYLKNVGFQWNTWWKEKMDILLAPGCSARALFFPY